MDDDQFDDALDESGRLRLYTTCPAGHPAIQAFSLVEWRDGLSRDRLVFECFYCGVKWTPSRAQCLAILAQIAP